MRATGFVTYLWSTGATTSCIIASLPGDYQVTVTNASGCSGVCSTNVHNFTVQTSNSDSLPEENGYLLIKAYPNPFYDKATLEFVNSESDSHVVIEAFKINGTNSFTLFDGEVEQGKIYKAELDAGNLSAGVYVCRITNGSQIIIKKMILIR